MHKEVVLKDLKQELGFLLIFLSSVDFPLDGSPAEYVVAIYGLSQEQDKKLFGKRLFRKTSSHGRGYFSWLDSIFLLEM